MAEASGMDAEYGYRGMAMIKRPTAQACIAVCVSFLLLASGSRAAEFYVSPKGAKDGDGSKEKPWDIETALAQPEAVKPGDTIWLRGGQYVGEWPSKLTGTADKPIIVRQYPGEKATVDGFAHHPLIVTGQYTWYWGFEVMSGNDQRLVKDELSYKRGTILVLAPNNKFISLIVHDLMDGISAWKAATNTEVCGCLIYYSGRAPDWPETPREGQGITTQNDKGTKVISDNIIFSNFNAGIFVHGSEKATVCNYQIAGNILFNNGVLAGPGRMYANLLVGGGGITKDGIQIEENATYYPLTEISGANFVGLSQDAAGKQFSATNNYWVGGAQPLVVSNWARATFTGNTVCGLGGGVTLNTLPEQNTTKYDWNRNTYFVGEMFHGAKKLDPAGWRVATGIDAGSTWKTDPLKGIWTLIRPNKYEPGRANIAIYNWDMKDKVDVDLSKAGLKAGDAYEVRDVQNYFGKAVVTGTYDGMPVSIPMSGLTVAKPVGNLPIVPPHTGPAFGTFVIMKALQAAR
jgi:hypothetical protein